MALSGPHELDRLKSILDPKVYLKHNTMQYEKHTLKIFPLKLNYCILSSFNMHYMNSALQITSLQNR